MLDQLGAAVGDVIQIGGTPFEVRGSLGGIPDAPVRGFRLGVPVVITTEALAILGDRTSPLPGLGTFFHYKVLLERHGRRRRPRPPSRPRSAIPPGPSAPRATASARWCATTTSSCAS